MDISKHPSFESLYSNPPRPSSAKGHRSPRFLSVLKCFTRPSSRKGSVHILPEKAKSENDLPLDRPETKRLDSHEVMWKRRGHTPGMDDYLTLEQLENDIWCKQDHYLGSVPVPQATQYTFTEAVEAPLIADHSTDVRRQQQRRPPPDLNRRLPILPRSDSPTCIDGAVHPALRSTPHIQEPSPEEPAMAPSSRFAVTVPDTNWTYGRDG